jgi:hypothetical protein
VCLRPWSVAIQRTNEPGGSVARSHGLERVFRSFSRCDWGPGVCWCGGGCIGGVVRGWEPHLCGYLGQQLQCKLLLSDSSESTDGDYQSGREGTLNTNKSERTDVLAMQISLTSNSQKRTYQLFLVHVSLHYCAESPICHVDTYRKMLNL